MSSISRCRLLLAGMRMAYCSPHSSAALSIPSRSPLPLPALSLQSGSFLAPPPKSGSRPPLFHPVEKIAHFQINIKPVCYGGSVLSEFVRTPIEPRGNGVRGLQSVRQRLMNTLGGNRVVSGGRISHGEPALPGRLVQQERRCGTDHQTVVDETAAGQLICHVICFPEALKPAIVVA